MLTLIPAESCLAAVAVDFSELDGRRHTCLKRKDHPMLSRSDIAPYLSYLSTETTEGVLLFCVGCHLKLRFYKPWARFSQINCIWSENYHWHSKKNHSKIGQDLQGFFLELSEGLLFLLYLVLQKTLLHLGLLFLWVREGVVPDPR